MSTTTRVTNGIHRQQKLYFIRPGRYHLFGTDFEVRDSMPDDQAVARFDEVWNQRIKDPLLSGDPIDYEETLGLLWESARTFCKRRQEHRMFRLADTVFVAQLERRGGGYSHNQLWAVPAKNFDTRTLFVTFCTQYDRNGWNGLANRLGFKPEDLGLRLLTGLMEALAERPQEEA